MSAHTGPVVARTSRISRALDAVQEQTPTALAPYLDDLDAAAELLENVVDAVNAHRRRPLTELRFVAGVA